MSVLSDITAAALTLTRTIAGEAITYRRGALSVPISLAIPLGGARLEERDGGLILQSDHLEWGINRTDLVDDGDELTPQRGDTIEWTHKGRDLTFSVLPDGAGQCWRWSDRGQSQRRIFTKLKSNEEA